MTLTSNSLVIHRRFPLRTGLGIGVVVKALKTCMHVNFGERFGVMKVKTSELEEVDTSATQTITYKEFKRKNFTNGHGGQTSVIIGNELKDWVGIGWVRVRNIVEEDLKLYPRLVD